MFVFLVFICFISESPLMRNGSRIQIVLRGKSSGRLGAPTTTYRGSYQLSLSYAHSYSAINERNHPIRRGHMTWTKTRLLRLSHHVALGLVPNKRSLP